jgi:hypothetical protein
MRGGIDRATRPGARPRGRLVEHRGSGPQAPIRLGDRTPGNDAKPDAFEEIPAPHSRG